MTDVAVGTKFDDDGGTDRGAVWVLFLNTNGTVKSHQKISDTEGNFTGVLGNSGGFGVSVSSLGDLDGDGVTDLAVGATGDDDGGTNRGAVWVLFLSGPAPLLSVSISENLPGGATMDLVSVPSGTFTMGTTAEEQQLLQNRGLWQSWMVRGQPAHQVTISKGFYLGKYEITQGQWQAVMGTTPWSGQNYVQENSNNPAAYISWDDVQNFIQQLNEAAGDLLYRLPTEAEWEYAARAGTTTLWSFGDDEGRLGNYAWCSYNAKDVGERYAHEAGTRLPNPWGVYDIHGNLWEWVQDRYSDSYYSSSPSIDPQGPESGGSRVYRGGDYDGTVWSSIRGYASPDYRHTPGSRVMRRELFGTVASGTSSGKTLTISNLGTATLTISSLTISGTDAGMFSFSGVSTPFDVAPGGSQNITVQFDPTSAGRKSATLSITHNATGSPTNVLLSGTGGASPPVTVSLPEVTATYNESIQIPVRINHSGDQEIVSAELFVSFSSGSSGGLLPVFSSGVSAMGIISGWSLESNVVFSDAPTPGRIDILKMAMATDDEPIGNTGGIRDLLMLSFQVADIRHPATAPLTLTHILFNNDTPGYIATNGSIKLVGTNSTIASDPDVIIPRWPIQVAVTDVDEDRNTGSADAIDVRVTNGGQTESITVTETGNSTGLFEGSIATVFSLGSTSGDNVVQARAGDAIVFCYDDSLDAAGNTVERCATTNVIGGTDGTIRTTVVSQPGDTVRVRVEDADLSGSVAVTATNPRTSESESILLSIFTPGTSVFYGRVFTDRGAAAGPPDDDVLNVLKADVLLITYADTLTANGGTAAVVDDDEVVDPFGDADGNGQSISFDAHLVLRHRLLTYGGGPGILSGLDSLSANVDQAAPFGIIDGYDASLILQKRVGLIDRFEVQEPDAVNHPQPETNLLPKPVLEERRLALVPGAGYVSVWCADRGEIVSGELTLEGVQGQVVMGEELQAFLTASQAMDGGLQVVFAGVEAVSGAGELLRVAGVGSGDVQLTRVSFNGGQIGARWEEGSTSITLPVSFVLYPNMPNPFNPETTIRYDVPVAGSVSLRIYDVTGQVVRELVRDSQPAGSYSVVWDGRNERGNQVANSVYLYELRAGDYRAIRKMVLMK